MRRTLQALRRSQYIGLRLHRTVKKARSSIATVSALSTHTKMKAGSISFFLATLFLVIGTCSCDVSRIAVRAFWKGGPGVVSVGELSQELKIKKSNGEVAHELWINNPFPFDAKDMGALVDGELVLLPDMKKNQKKRVKVAELTKYPSQVVVYWPVDDRDPQCLYMGQYGYEQVENVEELIKLEELKKLKKLQEEKS
ncbi:hypothetical protein PCANC_13003 [Puccinia coronata f. sp. avenae]|uniref:Uncharacterized protein n=1 Tax=Puccinia coronata f. sp. avenae TaxID=200324 RepID=A0A2N5VHH0_9BASI|nr:hypothetical protein PCANC_13003 [Puccinia coronata f. sp. avenae]PLW49435.1 hypothetical protein PCASD_01930 [Puccinia coronata f. sp. avenae]